MAVKDSLYRLRLVDGLEVEQEGKKVRYHSVILRETNVGHERQAVELSERLMKVPGGSYKLVVSQETYMTALVMKAIQKIEQNGLETIDEHVLDLDLMDKLSRPDLTAIEERVALIEMAALVRHGQISEDHFHQVLEEALSPNEDKDSAPEKRSESQAERNDVVADSPGAGIELLADHSGSAHPR